MLVWIGGEFLRFLQIVIFILVNQVPLVRLLDLKLLYGNLLVVDSVSYLTFHVRNLLRELLRVLRLGQGPRDIERHIT